MKIINLNVSLAWERVKKDLRKRNFVNASLFYEIVDYHNVEWLRKLKADFEEGTYCPTSMEVVEIPKGKGLVRPGSLLSIEDNIFYASLVQECYLSIFNKIEWAQDEVDFANIPCCPTASSKDWFQDRISNWNRFREKSMSYLDQGYEFVVVTDITGYFENIDVDILSSELKTCNVHPFIIENLRRCLIKWSQIPGKGIPQGNSASDLLAKLYLNTVDQGMRNAGYYYIRYVDDIRIFCKDEIEAKEGLKELIRLLRKRGLNLQSAKTKILHTSIFLEEEIESTQRIINTLTNKFKDELNNMLSLGDPYQVVDEGILTNDETPVEVFKEAFRQHFIKGDESKFDKTLFHFLINNLTKYKQPFAVNHCLSLLEEHPEETEHILKYCTSIDATSILGQRLNYVCEQLLNFINSRAAIYDYQNFQILSWLREYSEFCVSGLLTTCRKIAFDNNKPYYYRFVARDILGREGNSADLEKLEDYISLIHSEIEKAELLFCLRRIEKSRRNAFFGRVASEGPRLKMTVEYIKSSLQ
ncbi:MAG: RNA-directed DNA polymerase [Flavobacterium sp.]|nr:MAG: RNA-directed DNA polymerase [Flavobacterium sp.]